MIERLSEDQLEVFYSISSAIDDPNLKVFYLSTVWADKRALNYLGEGL